MQTAVDCVADLRQRVEEKRQWRRKPVPPPLPPGAEEEAPIAAEDEPDFEADGGPEFEGIALAAELTLTPTLMRLSPR
jgi:hypothetical protein